MVAERWDDNQVNFSCALTVEAQARLFVLWMAFLVCSMVARSKMLVWNTVISQILNDLLLKNKNFYNNIR